MLDREDRKALAALGLRAAVYTGLALWAALVLGLAVRLFLLLAGV